MEKHCHHKCCEHQHEHKHHHEHEHESLKGKIILIVLTVVLLIGAVLIEKNYNLATWQMLLVYLVPYLLIGHDTLREAWEGITEGEMMNEHFLMAIATIGALTIGFLPNAEPEFAEAVFVMLFFQIGELFEGYAEGKSRDSIAHLMDIRPDVAHVEPAAIATQEGVPALRDMKPEEVSVGAETGRHRHRDGRIG